MKKILYFCVASLLMISLYSCDKVDPPYMTQTGPDTSTTSHVRKILVEDYTGHNCPNCPGAGVIAEDIKSLYGNKVVLLTVHAGWFANPACGVAGGHPAIDFQTTAGTDYDTFFGISALGNPNGMINRISVGGSQVISPSSWTSIVDTMVTKDPDAYIEITNSYNPTTRALDITLESEFLNAANGTYKLCVLIKEDNIHSWQQNNDAGIGTTPIIADYTHHNVLRMAVNGSWGDTLATGVIPAATSVVKNYNVASLNSSWDDSNCSVVAFIYNTATYTIVQAEEKKIK
jgi:predicted RNA-binding Zn-ribbon protein involved in translation (DUF1610 family)